MALKKHILIQISASILLLAGLSGIILFIPPMNIMIIGVMIIFAASLCFSVSRFFLSRIYSFLIALAVGILLIVSYLTGFNILNTILLLSFIIGVGVLLKKE